MKAKLTLTSQTHQHLCGMWFIQLGSNSWGQNKFQKVKNNGHRQNDFRTARIYQNVNFFTLIVWMTLLSFLCFRKGTWCIFSAVSYYHLSYLYFTDWSDEAVSKAEILRLIYQGRFLHSNVTLGALALPFGKTTVMHLVPRETLPEPNSQGINTFLLVIRTSMVWNSWEKVFNFTFFSRISDQRQKSKGGSSSCCSTSCSIL